ncbi:MAG: outer membrane beta-barrel protein [Marinoscillum sp.]
MTPNALSYGSKILACLFLLCLTTLSVAQRKSSPPSSFESFLNTQWWLGLRFGLNYTEPNSITRYSVFSPINYESETLEKEYEVFNLAGGQAGLDISFYHNGFSIGIQPTFKIMRYQYLNRFEWLGDGNEDGLETTLDVTQKLDIIEVPLILKYEVIKRGKVRPFVLAGLQQSFIIATQKKVKIEHVDFLSDNPQTYSGGTYALGNTDRMQNFYGAVGGIGTSLDYANIRTVVEVTYLRGLSAVTSSDDPFSENELVALGDVNDELKINNLNISLSFVFPLRYIDKTFQPY